VGMPAAIAHTLPHFNWKKAGLPLEGFDAKRWSIAEWRQKAGSGSIRGDNSDYFSAVGCILPENNSTFRNLVNLAIAKLLQGYLNGDPTAVATVDRWVGPSGILGLPPEVIRLYFQTVLLNHEQIQLPAAGAAKPSVN